MDEQQNDDNTIEEPKAPGTVKKGQPFNPAGFALGIALGISLGVALDNIAVGFAMGAGFGLLFAMTMSTGSSE